MIVVFSARRGIKNIVPLFVTCDPDRDSPQVVKEYLAGRADIIILYYLCYYSQMMESSTLVNHDPLVKYMVSFIPMD